MTINKVRDAISHHLSSWTQNLSYLREDPSENEAFAEVTHLVSTALQGGKRTRALLLYAGMACTQEVNFPQAVNAGSALELFQASALIHDDVIDNSPLRRSKPSTHIALAETHREAGWVGNADNYGKSGAITIGDLLLAGASSQFERAIEVCQPDVALRSLRFFNTMMTEVAYGQFLDIREENLPLDTPQPLERALAIVKHKSARYSVELPLVIGASLCGASNELMTHLRYLGLALGIAFQLRDDDLGIFGDPHVTGKPACGDITEGKRTVLLALIREYASAEDRAFLDAHIGLDLDEKDIFRIQDIGIKCGAQQAHEELIARYEKDARHILTTLDARHEGKEILSEIMEELSFRIA